jgi:hypothetical protein
MAAKKTPPKKQFDKLTAKKPSPKSRSSAPKGFLRQTQDKKSVGTSLPEKKTRRSSGKTGGRRRGKVTLANSVSYINSKTKRFPATYFDAPIPREIVSPTDKHRGRIVALDKLSPELYSRMLEGIRLGGFDHVAAAAIGVVPWTFNRWKAKGRENLQKHEEEGEALNCYGLFYQDITKAAGDARLVSEAKVYRYEPLNHLRVGPGKTTEECPGWTEKVTHVHEGGDKPIEVDLITHGDKAERLVGAMQVLEQLGLIAITPHGSTSPPFADKETIPQPLLETNGNGNGRR